MPLTHHIYSDVRLLLIVGDGTITQTERIQTILACLGNPGYASCDFALVDLTRSDSIPSLEELRELIAFIREHLRRVGPRKLAIVASKALAFEFARSFRDLLSAPTLALDVAVFIDREAAWQWLRG